MWKTEAAEDMPPQISGEFFTTRIEIQGVRDGFNSRTLVLSQRRLKRNQFCQQCLVQMRMQRFRCSGQLSGRRNEGLKQLRERLVVCRGLIREKQSQELLRVLQGRAFRIENDAEALIQISQNSG